MVTLSDFRDTAVRVLQAHDALVNLWRNIPTTDFANASPGDLELLKSLILRRIYPNNAFEVLAHLSPESAVEMLLARYLGKSVDPDKKFGGFEFELEGMLDDLSNIAGKDQLLALIKDEDFDLSSLEDPRVRRSFGEALGIEESQVAAWVGSQFKGQTS